MRLDVDILSMAVICSAFHFILKQWFVFIICTSWETLSNSAKMAATIACGYAKMSSAQIPVTKFWFLKGSASPSNSNFSSLYTSAPVKRIKPEGYWAVISFTKIVFGGKATSCTTVPDSRSLFCIYLITCEFLSECPKIMWSSTSTEGNFAKNR